MCKVQVESTGIHWNPLDFTRIQKVRPELVGECKLQKKTAAQKAPVKKKDYRKQDMSPESSDDSDNSSEALTGPKQKPHKWKKIVLHKDDQSDTEPEVIEDSNVVEDGGCGDARNNDEVRGNIFKHI